MGFNFNPKIKRLFVSDQKDRKNLRFDKKNLVALRAKDDARKMALEKILREEKKFTAKNLYMIAMLYQHGANVSDYKKARSFAKRSAGKGFEKAKWLYAAATDRLFVNQGKKQKYGTQYQKKNNKWILYPVNNLVTDKEREKYNVPPLKKALAELKKLNRG